MKDRLIILAFLLLLGCIWYAAIEQRLNADTESPPGWCEGGVNTNWTVHAVEWGLDGEPLRSQPRRGTI